MLKAAGHRESTGLCFFFVAVALILSSVICTVRAQAQDGQSTKPRYSSRNVGPFPLSTNTELSEVKGNGPGLTIIPTFDPSISAAAQAVINEAISFYNHAYTTNITVNIYFNTTNASLGESLKPIYGPAPYTTYREALAATATSADDTTALNNTPAGANNPVNNGADMDVSSAGGRAIGLGTPEVALGSNAAMPPGNPCPTTTAFTGSGCIGLEVSTAGSDLLAVVEHEIDEVLSLGSNISGTTANSNPLPQDLFRWASAGTRSYAGNASTTIPCSVATPTAYFSIDGGNTNLDFFNNCNNGGDYGDWIEHSPSQVQDAFTNPNSAPFAWLNITTPEARTLDVTGYSISFKSFADKAIFRPSTGQWFVIPRTNPASPTAQQWGTNGDTPLRGDFDGDGQNDIVIWRPSNGTWYIIPSSNPGTPIIQPWGTTGDIPVPGDYDGDGVTDYAVFRPSNGTWYIILSSTGAVVTEQWGTNGDVPVPGDYDGDRITDFAVWRPSTGTWYIIPSSNPGTPIVQQWGATISGVQDIPVVGDYDGDGKSDFAVWRPSSGTWYVIPSSNPGTPIVTQWGNTISGVQDVPVPGDYDGDARTDMAVWRPSSGVWYVLPSTTPGFYTATGWGTTNDVPVQNPGGR